MGTIPTRRDRSGFDVVSGYGAHAPPEHPAAFAEMLATVPLPSENRHSAKTRHSGPPVDSPSGPPPVGLPPEQPSGQWAKIACQSQESAPGARMRKTNTSNAANTPHPQIQLAAEHPETERLTTSNPAPKDSATKGRRHAPAQTTAASLVMTGMSFAERQSAARNGSPAVFGTTHQGSASFYADPDTQGIHGRAPTHWMAVADVHPLSQRDNGRTENMASTSSDHQPVATADEQTKNTGATTSSHNTNAMANTHHIATRDAGQPTSTASNHRAVTTANGQTENTVTTTSSHNTNAMANTHHIATRDGGQAENTASMGSGTIAESPGQSPAFDTTAGAFIVRLPTDGMPVQRATVWVTAREPVRLSVTAGTGIRASVTAGQAAGLEEALAATGKPVTVVTQPGLQGGEDNDQPGQRSLGQRGLDQQSSERRKR